MARSPIDQSSEILRRKFRPVRRGHQEGPPQTQVGVAVDGDQLPEERRRRMPERRSSLG